MSPFWLASALFVVALGPAGVAVFRGGPLDRLVALEMAATVVTLLLVTLAEAMHRTAFLDLALALAVLSFGGGLVFARFFERWL